MSHSVGHGSYASVYLVSVHESQGTRIRYAVDVTYGMFLVFFLKKQYLIQTFLQNS